MMREKFNRVLITGASGMLGKAFQEVLNLKYPDADVKALSSKVLDVTDHDEVMSYIQYNPDLIIHTAAKVDANFCEDHYEQAKNIIVNGTRNIIELADACNAKVLYPQSFLIFDGKVNPINEETIPNPLSTYGLLKFEAEKAIVDSNIDSLIIRMAGFFGGYQKDKNFVGKIIPVILGKIKSGVNEIEVGDRVWQPTYTFDLALNSMILLENNESGFYSMSSLNSASFYQLAVKITEYLGIDSLISVKEVSSQQFDKAEAAKRPHDAILSNEKLDRKGMNSQRNWEESLLEYLDDDYYKNMIKDMEI
jgi:dTDP-4-dehydrorhamnose reductase